MSSMLAVRLAEVNAADVLTAALLFSALCAALAIAFLVEQHVRGATRSLASLALVIPSRRPAGR